MNSETSQNIVDIDDSNAQQLLIDESQKRLVLANFWVENSEPCSQVRQILEQLASEYAGDFLLGNINAAEQQMLAQQLRVQTLPTVMFIKDGQPVDGFAGPQEEAQIRDYLDKYLPKPWDKQLLQAQELINNKDFSQALSLLRTAHEDSGQRSDIGLSLSLCYIEINRLDEAESILGNIPMADQDALFEQLSAQIHLKRTAGKTPETEALEQANVQDPDNLEIKMQLAVQYYQEQHTKEALEHLIQILRADKEFQNGEAKRTMLDIFKSLGNQDPLVAEYQRQLFSLLY